MFSRRLSRLLLAATAPLLVSCADGESPTGPPDVPGSDFGATITGDQEATFQASGFYLLGPPPQLAFSLSASSALGEGTGQGFLIFGDGGVPAVGSHALGLAEDGLRATYTRATGPADLVAYLSSEGELEVTAASDDRLEGTFRFTAFRYCRIENGVVEGPCSPPAEAIADAPEIQVTGSFSAIDHYSIPVLEVVEPATIDFYDEPVVIQVPSSVSRGQRFTVLVRSYGDGCTRFERTDVSIRGLRATVAPYDREQRGGACTQQLVLLDHTAELSFAEAGTARIVFRGRSRPGGGLAEFVRTVQVR